MSAEQCRICGQVEHADYCYEAVGWRAACAEYDYVEALFASEPAEDVAA